MATEKSLELIDAYLSNKLDSGARAALEQQLAADPGLTKEFEFQKQLIEGIRAARASQLKAMLSNTVVPPVQTGSVLVKVAATFLIAAAAGTGIYYWLSDDDGSTIAQQEIVAPALPDQPTVANDVIEEPQDQLKEEVPVIEQQASITNQQDAKKHAEGQPTKATSMKPVKQPNLTPYDPTAELKNTHAEPDETELVKTNSSVATSSVQVETDNSNKKLNFHYQFKDNKVVLYGSFEDHLYTILEFFNDNKRTIFLNHNAKYYLLDEAQHEPKQLKALTDPALLKKLQEYKGN